MIKLILTLVLFLISLNIVGQEQFFKYKKVCDEIIKTHIDTSLFASIHCKTFWLKSVDKTTKYESVESFFYEKEKFKKEIFTTITFQYFFYSPVLNDTVPFGVTLNSKKKPLFKEILLEELPICVKQNSHCNFITKDSALNIALKTKIRYSENISVKFEKAPLTNSFYWVVLAQPKQLKSPVQKRRFASGYGEIDVRYINAETGIIITGKDFFKRL